MNKKKIGILITLLIMVGGSTYGQEARSFCINEVLVNNTDNFQDDYGKQTAWIELFNTSFASVDIKSCFLTNDKRVLDNTLTASQRMAMMYPIPKGDVLTKVHPRQHLLFWADGQPQRGNFHVSFTLDSVKTNWIALYDSNGTTLLDSITVPANMPANCSYALIEDGVKAKGWAIKGVNGTYVTPSTNNKTLDSNDKIDGFKEKDPLGIGMSIVAMIVVFSGLVMLYLSFKVVGAISVKLAKRNAMKAQGITDKKEAKEKAIGTESGEIFAVIALALHQYQDNVHDIEDTILTINKVKRNYSPWSSKIYTLRETPKR